MGERRRRTDQEVLRDCWSRWTAIVALFTERRPARRRIGHRTYAALRNDLIATCRSLAEADGKRRSYYTALEEIVLPWLSPRVFARTDHEILCTLLSRCREVERELAGRKWMLVLSRYSSRLATIMVGAIILGIIWPVLAVGARVVLDALGETAFAVRITAAYVDFVPRWSLLVAIVITAAMYAVSRAVRA